MVGPFESISPLPAEIRRCLMAMAGTGLASLVAAGLLWLHITYRLIRWKIRDRRFQRQQREAPAGASARHPASTAHHQVIDLNLGLAESHYYQARYQNNNNNKNAHDMPPPLSQKQPLERTDTMISQVAVEQGQGGQPQYQSPTSTRREKPPNPLLLLIYNLILADVVLSASYMNNFSWLHQDGIIAPSRTCTAQGFIVSIGCLTTSGFLFAISVFSYLGIIRGYKAKSRDVGIACAFVWVMSLVLASVGLIFVRDSTFYGRETNWCWISEKHRLWRLCVYLWGFPAMIGTCSIYSLIFYRLYQEGRSSRYMPRRGSQSTVSSRGGIAVAAMHTVDTNTNNNNHAGQASTPLRPSGHHPAFLIYPCIYTITGTPLILGSLIPVLERNAIFMGTAGGLLASTGLLDAILWSSIIVFSRREDIVNTGLDQFSFMRTPEGRTLGNIVFVQGGQAGGDGADGSGAGAAPPYNNSNNKDNGDRNRRRQSWHSKKEKGWWRLGDRNSSQTNLTQERMPDVDGGIQMEVVTSVVVEGQDGSVEDERRRHSRELHSRGASADTSHSKYF